MSLLHIRRYTFFLLCSLFAMSSCQEYLDEKPVKNQAVPNSLEDLQALLDNDLVMNTRASAMSEAVADNYYVTAAVYGSSSVVDRDQYVWHPQANTLQDWNLYHQFSLSYANIVLDQLAGIGRNTANALQHDQVHGAALFFRSFAFWQVAQLYCRPYSASANTDPGIPLRTNSAIETPSVRSTVQQTYDRILADLKTAVRLLPVNVHFATRPSKPAAYAALARTYLSMGDYPNAGLYADSCLQLYNTLIDYNTLVPVGTPPVKRLNAETIFFSSSIRIPSILFPASGRVDSVLAHSYDDKDLRKVVFLEANLDDSHSFRGSYNGDLSPSVVFAGFAVDEVLLIRAESRARTGQHGLAMDDLNALLVKRWLNDGSFAPLTAANATEAVDIILRERRKELLYRGLRWSDLRRLNVEGAGITLTRKIGSETYTLPPNDPRWVLLIPHEVITISGMPQNVRN